MMYCELCAFVNPLTEPKTECRRPLACKLLQQRRGPRSAWQQRIYNLRPETTNGQMRPSYKTET